MRPCGMATPWPRPVEPSFSRANRLSKTTLRAMLCVVLEQQAGLLEQALLARHVAGRCRTLRRRRGAWRRGSYGVARWSTRGHSSGRCLRRCCGGSLSLCSAPGGRACRRASIAAYMSSSLALADGCPCRARAALTSVFCRSLSTDRMTLHVDHVVEVPRDALELGAT